MDETSRFERDEIRRAADAAAAGASHDTTQTHDADLSFVPFGADLTEAELEAIEALPSGAALLIVRSGPTTGARYLLDTDVTTVGRHPEADLFFDDVTVSRPSRRDPAFRQFVRDRRPAFAERKLRQRRAGRSLGSRQRRRGAHRQVPPELLRLAGRPARGRALMAAAPSRSRQTAAGLLSIGQVLARLTPDFPALTSSKLRFLEVQGIVSPTRTESGYRKFSPADLERLRLALTLQRDHYLPLVVIRDYLADLDAGRNPAPPTSIPSMTSAPRRYRREELLSAAGARPQLLNDAVSTGVIAGADTYSEQAVTLLRALVALDRHGIEPRHIRSLRQSAEREVSLVESALSALLRRPDAPSRARASELAPELAARLDEVRTMFVRDALERILS
ncbi:DNA-binding transcriptional MerR regulator [Microbacterium sp. SORGH_AS454]|nr:DNA-binding transcriptional MerR regulator [Microbacterium sp. SORGH_AS_0454]